MDVKHEKTVYPKTLTVFVKHLRTTSCHTSGNMLDTFEQILNKMMDDPESLYKFLNRRIIPFCPCDSGAGKPHRLQKPVGAHVIVEKDGLYNIGVTPVCRTCNTKEAPIVYPCIISCLTTHIPCASPCSIIYRSKDKTKLKWWVDYYTTEELKAEEKNKNKTGKLREIRSVGFNKDFGVTLTGFDLQGIERTFSVGGNDSSFLAFMASQDIFTDVINKSFNKYKVDYKDLELVAKDSIILCNTESFDFMFDCFPKAEVRDEHMLLSVYEYCEKFVSIMKQQHIDAELETERRKKELMWLGELHTQRKPKEPVEPKPKPTKTNKVD